MSGTPTVTDSTAKLRPEARWIHIGFSQQDVDDAVSLLFGKGRFGKGQLLESHLRALETGIRVLHNKGYGVRVFRNPVPSVFIASAQHRFTGPSSSPSTPSIG